MKTWIAATAVLLFTTLFAASTAQAYGTYCNARASDGIWGFFFGPQPVWYHCDRVREGMAWNSRGVITDWSRGYYNDLGWNTVYVNCLGFQWQQAGYGSDALQAAYVTAANSGATYCLFSVYY